MQEWMNKWGGMEWPVTEQVQKNSSVPKTYETSFGEDTN